MIQIVPWGKLFTKDAAGFIVNDGHADKIVPPWIGLVEELCQICQDVWHDRRYGLYLRGSIPRGLAIPNVSDLDSFVVFSGKITPDDLDRSRHIAKRLNARYLCCQNVELILLTEAIVQAPQSVWPGIIQTRSLKIAGDLLPFKLPRFKPGYSLLNYAQTWETDLSQTLKTLMQLSPDRLNFSAQVRQRSAWIMRRLVRTGFELVMERDQSYTPDLYYCYERFSTYFPEQQVSMKKALELAINPSANRPGLMVFLRRFGGWMTTQVRLKLL